MHKKQSAQNVQHFQLTNILLNRVTYLFHLIPGSDLFMREA